MPTENKPEYIHEIVLLDFDEIFRTMGTTGKEVIIDQENIINDFIKRHSVAVVTDQPNIAALDLDTRINAAFLQNLGKTVFYASYFRWVKEEGKLYAKISPAFEYQVQDILDLLKTGAAKLIPRLVVQSSLDVIKLKHVVCIDISIVDFSLASVSLGLQKSRARLETRHCSRPHSCIETDQS